MPRRDIGGILAGLVLALMLVPRMAPAAELVNTVKRVKPSIVGVGVFSRVRRPPMQLFGTGFAVADGRYVITNAHVVRRKFDKRYRESLAVTVGNGRRVTIRRAENIGMDVGRDVAVLRMFGPPIPALTLGDDATVREGQEIAFMGFPIGAVLGPYPVTHRGIVSAITPIATPLLSSRRLDAETMKRLRNNFHVFQLDATAYPGNSGSPVFDPQSGRVYAIISSVYVKRSKERVLQEPSGISYAIPIRYARALLRRVGVLK